MYYYEASYSINIDKKILMEGMSQISHLYNLPSEEQKAPAQTRGMSTERELRDMNLLFHLRSEEQMS